MVMRGAAARGGDRDAGGGATIVLIRCHEARPMEVVDPQDGQLAGSAHSETILAQVGLETRADLQVRDGVIEIRPVKRNPREGWAEDAKRVADSRHERWNGRSSAKRQ
jgi:hypothetical protein